MTGLLDLAAIRASHPLPAIVAASVKLIRAGNEWKTCCPFHEDRSPSLTIFDGGQRYHCFGCGASGDVLDWMQRLHSVGLKEAAAMLDGGQVPVVVHRPGLIGTTSASGAQQTCHPSVMIL
ncbi:MAG: CHC2 zinc finger domain-containing protein [Sphingomicrobium sp.]